VVETKYEVKEEGCSMAINVVEMVEVSRVMSEIKGGKIEKWVSEDTHEDIVVIDEKGNRYEVKYISANPK